MTAGQNQINELTQCSRRNCLRIMGMKEEINENTDQLIIDMASNNLDIQQTDMFFPLDCHVYCFLL